MIQQIKACSICFGRGCTIDGKPCPCGCMPHVVTSKPEDYGLPTYRQLQQQIATLTRQRDLAVRALEDCKIYIQDTGQPLHIYRRVADTLSAIKESDVK